MVGSIGDSNVDLWMCFFSLVCAVRAAQHRNNPAGTLEYGYGRIDCSLRCFFCDFIGYRAAVQVRSNSAIASS